MKIGFDAKRAFFNKSGLGNYSRDLIRSLDKNFPESEYHLYTPSLEGSIPFMDFSGVEVSTPFRSKGKLMQSYWRSMKLANRLDQDNIDVFHGLSNELPKSIQRRKVKSVVTIHDLIFLRHPEWYNPIDRAIYQAKFKYSCRVADRIIAISEQTKRDIIEFYRIDEQKISVIYQSCNTLFKQTIPEAFKETVRKKYDLPDRFLLYVGTIEERKNLLNIVMAITAGRIDIPLVVIGRKTKYYNKVKHHIESENLKGIYFKDEVSIEDLPAIYQLADLFIYPSVFEGFGIPILEALYSKVPVITSKGGCFSEVGGASTVYVDPTDIGEISEAIKYISSRKELQEEMIEKGYLHARKFSSTATAQSTMNIYKQLIDA